MPDHGAPDAGRAPRSPLARAALRLAHAVSWLSRGAAVLAAALMVYVLAHILYEIVLRVFFASSTFVLDEFVGYAVGAMTFLALAHTLDHGTHIRVDLAIGRLRGRARRIGELFSVVATFAVTLFALSALWKTWMRNIERGAVSESVAEVPLWIPQAGLILGLVLLLLQLFAYAVRLVLGETPQGGAGAE
jgi:TRAP-type C4-dicarboxylate transport system permease small subunit